MAVGHQPVEEHGPERRAGRGPGQGRQRTRHGPRHGALRGAPGGLPERGLRRPDRPAAQAAAAASREVREKWQTAMGHVLVDEYQDTNATQYEVLKLLVGERGRFTAVGDDDQSIYGWRGATLDNLKRLPMDFPQLKVIKLEQNYRSTSAILRAANNVIGPNPKLFPKTLFSRTGRRRAGAHRRCRQRGARGRARGGAHPVASGANGLAARSGRTSRCCTAPTTRPGSSSRRCARRRFRTRSRAARASSTAPRSRTCAPGFACGSTTTTTRLSCAPSPRPSAASATPRCRTSALSRANTS